MKPKETKIKARFFKLSSKKIKNIPNRIKDRDFKCEPKYSFKSFFINSSCSLFICTSSSPFALFETICLRFFINLGNDSNSSKTICEIVVLTSKAFGRLSFKIGKISFTPLKFSI